MINTGFKKIRKEVNVAYYYILAPEFVWRNRKKNYNPVPSIDRFGPHISTLDLPNMKYGYYLFCRLVGFDMVPVKRY
jgi:hypothetical protein